MDKKKIRFAFAVIISDEFGESIQVFNKKEHAEKYYERYYDEVKIYDKK